MPTHQVKVDRALHLIHEYEQNPQCVWLHAKRRRLANQLKVRVNNPNVIAQHQSSWCGPAAFLRSFAKDDPAAYAHLILDLARRGEATFKGGPHSAVHLKPHPNIVRWDFTRTKIADADWVGLASLRDHLRHPRTTLRKLIGTGTYPPDIVKFYTEFGYQDVSDWTAERHLGAESAHGATHALRRLHCKVTMRIHSNMISNDPTQRQTNGGKHNHWVDLIEHVHWHGDPSRPDTPVSFAVFSWGRVVRVSGITSEQFLSNYYGFVSARY